MENGKWKMNFEDRSHSPGLFVCVMLSSSKHAYVSTLRQVQSDTASMYSLISQSSFPVNSRHGLFSRFLDLQKVQCCLVSTRQGSADR